MDDKTKDKIDIERKHKVKNAIIMAAGMSSRFAPLSYEKPKALLNIKGEILIERQIIQLNEAGISDITIVVGYKKEMFYYLKEKFNINIVENPEYKVRNNHSTLYYVKDLLANTYICSADNYFTTNVFESHVAKSYYSSVFAEGKTNEWCITSNDEGLITDVSIGGFDAWIMLGHVYFNSVFSSEFVKKLEKEYNNPETIPLLWEKIYINHINELPMYIRKYSKNIIFEFDTLDELRAFDKRYWQSTGSEIMQQLSNKLGCSEKEIHNTEPLNIKGETIGFTFDVNENTYKYLYKDEIVEK